MNEDNDMEIYYGSRGNDFKDMLKTVLKKANLKEHYYNILLTEESLKEYGYAFTSGTADPVNNYEIYEQLGDLSANKFISNYMIQRFPKTKCPEGVKILARLKINYGSKQSFFPIAEKLGFWNYISSAIVERNKKKKDLLEDVLEAFIGVTELLIDNHFKHIGVGVGYSIVYNILESIFDELKISFKYEDLYDYKTRLKQLFDFNKLGEVTYKAERDKDKKITTSKAYDKNKTLLGVGFGSLQNIAEQNAAMKGIKYMNSQGFYGKPIDPIYNELDMEYNN
uniref:RNase III domain-containing protein n=1 Tax=viral metagenome TaxID=1070528 RepID=A0A6C0E1Y7_9ZZZZ